MRKLPIFVLVRYLAIIFLFAFSESFGQLSEGSIMFVGFNADANDGFAIVALEDIAANTTIYFNDNEWNGSAIGAGGAFNSSSEGAITWSTGGAVISAGTVVNFRDTRSSGATNYGASVGSISGTIAISASSEVIYAFLGSDDETPTTFLSAVANNGFGGNGTLANTGLADGVNATNIGGSEDVAVYSGSTVCNGTVAVCAADIANSANWDTQDGGGDQSQDGTDPDFPDDVPGSFGGVALPIELVKFGVIYDNQQVVASWKTASEINNDYFVLERSKDGRSWESVAETNGAGNSRSFLDYRVIDHQPLFGVSYYRLKQMDYDGTSTISSIIQINAIDDPQVSIFPNPANDILVVEGAGIIKITLSSFDGRRIDFDDFINTDQGLNIELDNYPNGHYILTVVSSFATTVKHIAVRH